MTRILKPLLKLSLTVVALGAFALLEIFAIFSHYFSLRTGLILAGTDQEPLQADQVLGVYLGSYFPKAALPHVEAVVIAGLIALLTFMLVHEAGRLLELWQHRQRYDNDPTERAEAARQMVRVGLGMLAMAVPLVFVARFDLEVTRYRAIGGMLGMEDAERATQLRTWSLQQSERQELWGVELAGIGAWALLFTTIGAAVAFGLLWQRAEEHALTLSLAFGAEWDALRGNNGPGGTFETGSVGSITAGGGEAGATGGGGMPSANTFPVGASAAVAPPIVPAVVPAGAAAGAAQALNVEDLPLPPSLQTPGSVPVSHAPSAAAGLREVIGAPAGTQVSLARALVEPAKYHVDADNGLVWDRGYWAQLEGEESSDGQEQAA